MNTNSASKIDAAVDKVLARYAPEPASLISVLEDVQEELRYLPREAIERISHHLGVSRNQSYHVATFFKVFSLKPKGRHKICVCKGTACHVQGAHKITDILQSELNISEGETTEDGQFTVESVRCLGCCSLAPAVMIDHDVYGQVNPLELHSILNRYNGKDSQHAHD